MICLAGGVSIPCFFWEDDGAIGDFWLYHVPMLKKKINGYLLKNRNTIYNSTSGDESQNEKKTDPIQDRDIEKRKQEMWW